MYTEYEAILKKQIWGCVLGLILVFALAIVLVILNKKIFKEDLGKIGRIFVNLFVVIVIVCATVYNVSSIYKIQDDMKHKSYITYNGEFEVSTSKDGYVTFVDETGKKITLSGKARLPGGVYNGTVVYSQKSECLLEYSAS